ncbi:LytTR family DNA-binding domain-containing protein [Pseudomonas sp. C9-3]|uniref:LytTR family DNA-binding domain-containing protein n=1 Tax=Pseudomonas sp. C9-3 TaxID=3078264 RepID=UPI0028EF1619|nr:LytTR family DNA-binding domain-containing protein [Pseudomonas sp. C9-3]
MRTHLTACFFRKTKSVAFAEITHFTAGDKYVTAHYPGGELVLTDTLNALETEFWAYTTRVHRGVLVKTHLIKSMFRDEQNKNALLRLVGVDDYIKVSRTHISEVAQIIDSRAMAA